MIKNLVSKKNRVLLNQMVKTDFKLRYQGSALGYIWSLLKPLMLFIILYIVFTQFLRIGKGIPNYPISLLLGIVLWSFFIEATSNSLRSIVGRGSLIRKIKIPRYIIPVSVVVSAFINLLLNLVVVAVFILFANDLPINFASLILFPLLLVELIAISLAVGFMLSAMYVSYRDVEHIWDVAKQALFYLVPIIYPLTLIPYESVQKALLLNPLAQIIQDSRALITYGETPTLYSLYGSFWVYLIPLSIVAFICVMSGLYFRKKSKTFAEDL